MTSATERINEHATRRPIRPSGPLRRPSTSEWVNRLATATP